jgi:hypothetical protein
MAYEFIARKGLIVSGSAVVLNGMTAASFTGSLFGTSSFAQTASFTQNTISSSFSSTASYIDGGFY